MNIRDRSWSLMIVRGRLFTLFHHLPACPPQQDMQPVSTLSLGIGVLISVRSLMKIQIEIKMRSFLTKRKKPEHRFFLNAVTIQI